MPHISLVTLVLSFQDNVSFSRPRRWDSNIINDWNSHTRLTKIYLLQDDVISVNDLDKLMPAGLGLRYAFLGALETSYLNANGKFMGYQPRHDCKKLLMLSSNQHPSSLSSTSGPEVL